MDYRSISSDELVRRCFEYSDDSAWREFLRRFQPLIARVALRVSRRWGESSAQAVDDLVQDTYLKLCGSGAGGLRNFKAGHEDSIFGYIKVFTANLVHDHFKSRKSQKRGGSAIVDPLECGDRARQETSNSEDMERHILVEQIHSCLRQFASDRDRRIFWLYYRAGLSASAIATLPTIDLGTKGVESTILRVTRLVRQQLTGQKESPSERAVQKGIVAPESF